MTLQEFSVMEDGTVSIVKSARETEESGGKKTEQRQPERSDGYRNIHAGLPMVLLPMRTLIPITATTTEFSVVHNGIIENYMELKGQAGETRI